MITAPHQRLPCVEDSALSLIQGDRAPSRCMKYTSTEKRAKAMGPDAPVRKAREGESLDTRAARYIACDSHAYLFSEDGSVISRKFPSAVFKWSGI